MAEEEAEKQAKNLVEAFKREYPDSERSASSRVLSFTSKEEFVLSEE